MITHSHVSDAKFVEHVGFSILELGKVDVLFDVAVL